MFVLEQLSVSLLLIDTISSTIVHVEVLVFLLNLLEKNLSLSKKLDSFLCLEDTSAFAVHLFVCLVEQANGKVEL